MRWVRLLRPLRPNQAKAASPGKDASPAKAVNLAKAASPGKDANLGKRGEVAVLDCVQVHSNNRRIRHPNRRIRATYSVQ